MVHTAFLAALGASEMMGLLRDTTLLGKTILLILFLLSVMSWAVMIDKARTLSAIRKGHAKFWRLCETWLERGGGSADLDGWCRG
ncbi:hypothetical protein KKA85_00530, partial [bacterium]|nr:hypothetical protein [bacterium]